MKHKHNPSYRSYLATTKRKHAESVFIWLKDLYMKQIFEAKVTPAQIRDLAVTGRISGKSLTCVIHDEVV